MATQPKPKPKPEPEPKPEDDDDAAVRMVPPQYRDDAAVDPEASLLERVENLENRMAAVEERQNAPPIRLGKRP